MTVVRFVCGIAAVLVIGVGSARAESRATLDSVLNEYIAAIDIADELAMATSCTMGLDNSGVGSQCSCKADGGNASCTCSGQGNKRICKCTDSSGTMHCFFCNNGGGCKCSSTAPTNVPHDPCQ